MLDYLVFAAAIAMLLAAFLYIRSMFRGGAKPNRVTWLLWSIAPFIATAASISAGAGWAALPVFMSGFVPFLIFTASFFVKKAYWKLSAFDYFCGVVSILALVLWYVTNEPNVAVGFAIASDGAAAIPTLRKARRFPQTESSWPYTLGIFNAATSFAVASVWSFSALAFPTYLIALNVVLTVFLFKKKAVS
jgi:hypothetical protein